MKTVMKKTKYRVIWIDDQRNPSYPINWKTVIPKEFADLVENKFPQIIWFKSCREWIKWAIINQLGLDNSYEFDCICLDHDLGDIDDCGKEWTGADVARIIVEDAVYNKKKLPFYECHSSNPVGKEKILSWFNSYEKAV